MAEFLLLLLIIATGFVASGLTGSLVCLATGRGEPVLEPKTDFGRLVAVGLTIFTGPVALLRRAWVASKEYGDLVRYLAPAVLLTLLWTYILGLFLVSIAIAL